MDSKKLLIIAAAGIGLYLFASSRANAAQRTTIAPGANAAPTGPAANREAATYNQLGQTIGLSLAAVRGLFGGGSTMANGGNYGKADEAGALARRYPAPPDAVPLNPPNQADPWVMQTQVYYGFDGESVTPLSL